MKRRIIWGLVLAISLVVLSGAWFLKNYERVSVPTVEEPQREARRNRFLALERLFERRQRPITTANTVFAIDRLPAEGTLLLDNGRRRQIDARRSDAILDWVSRGGYLIIAAERRAVDDPILKRLGVGWYRPPVPAAKAADPPPAEADADDDPEEEPEEKTEAPKPSLTCPAPDSFDAYIPGIDEGFRVEWGRGGLNASTRPPEWRAGRDKEQNFLLHFTHGAGAITVVADFSPFDNRRLGTFDHAPLLVSLVDRYKPQGPVRLATQLAVPTLWAWLAESAATVLLAAAALLVLWLWKIIPRFGGTLPPSPPDRRALRQHLAAIGRSVWREGGLSYWLDITRQRLFGRMALRRPQLLTLPAEQQQRALAELAGCSHQRIRLALEPGSVHTPEEFSQAIQTLRTLESKL